ncbi:MAG: heavy metal translocating P-type ATPase metal-binding domain-containing protein [Vicingaceae bacterium]
MSDTCFHCGDQLKKGAVVTFDNKSFCCDGCKLVYEIISSNQLGNYYVLEKNPGIKKSAEDFQSKYFYLENQEIADKLLSFKDENIQHVNLYIPTIHCSSCIWLLENLNQLHQEIISTRVNFIKKEVFIIFKTPLSLKDLVILLSSIGYEPLITLADEEKSKNKTQALNKKLLYKIGVAGFFGGNIMLMSFPEYFNDELFINSSFRAYFGYFNLALALPIIFYSAFDYFKKAVLSLKSKYISLDVPIALGITTLFLRSTYDVVFSHGLGFFDSLAGLVFFLLIGKWFQDRTYQNLSYERDYKSYFPVAVIKVTNGNEIPVSLEKLSQGDEFLIKNNEVIPCDAELLSNKANIDYSFVTGESAQVSVKKGDKIFAGGRQCGTTIHLKVLKPVTQSHLTQLWNQQTNNLHDQQQLNNIVNYVSKYFTIIVLLIAFISGTVWYFIDPTKIFHVITSVLIVACPCALALSVPFTFGNVLNIYSKNEFYLKNGEVIETLSKVDTLVFDKTGTITNQNAGNVEFEGVHLTPEIKQQIKSVIQHSLHPLNVQILNYLKDIKGDVEVDSFEEVTGKGIRAIINNKTILLGSAQFLKINEENDNLNAVVYLKMEEAYLGKFIIKNKYRPNIENIIKKLSKNFEIHLISGDNDQEKNYLKQFIKEQNLHFNLSPHEKLAYIKQLQNKGKVVAMIGDGLNDAGALKQSNVGIALTDNLLNFTPASDAILKGEKLQIIDKLLSFSKTAIDIIIASFIISFLYNIVGMWFSVKGLLSPLIAAVLMPVSSITIVLFTTLTSKILASKKGL